MMWGLSSFVAVWMFQKHWTLAEVHIGYFGVLWAVYNITVGISGKFAPWLEAKFGSKFMLFLIAGLPVAGYFSLAAFTGYLGVLLGLLINIGRGMTQVVLKEALNWRIPSEYRATLNSLVSLFFRGGFVIIGPIVGWAIDRYGLSIAFFSMGVFFILVFLLVTLPLVFQQVRAKGSSI